MSQSPFRTSLLEEADGPARNMTDNATMGEIIAGRFSRRGFMKGALAVSAISATVGPVALRPEFSEPFFRPADQPRRRSRREEDSWDED